MTAGKVISTFCKSVKKSTVNLIYVEFTPKKVILVGDSAGGNLISSLTNLCIMTKTRVPDGIFMVYPAVQLSLTTFTPSLKNTVDDILLPFSVLKICLNSYLKSNFHLAESSCFVSPLLTYKEVKYLLYNSLKK
jgi:hormone-sensitive lipase